MENQANSKSVILNYGLLTGGVSVLIALVLYAMGKTANPGIPMTALSFIIPIVLIVLGIKKFKDTNGGFMSWGQAVKVGVGIALLWGLLTIIFQYVLENFIAPELIEQKLEAARVAMENWGMDQDLIDTQLEKQRDTNPFFGAAMGLLFSAFIGFVISAIAGAIMKKTEEDQY
ncbi:hypothetical protein LPB136_02985 [Tenacibaculum todarodis]|uniref:DUF4199 domain-containing protein n=1 Tax=Tenacibaculum todarodis TaxID=1850252 RepID=A0A1L3JH04_9FLAO|nr:DUF4199 domain-containing protein [Tenacibaculum todarodis]APG64392.1 hypothetical protein LPB136_02985 [Tenacibaculum todarodis]